MFLVENYLKRLFHHVKHSMRCLCAKLSTRCTIFTSQIRPHFVVVIRRYILNIYKIENISFCKSRRKAHEALVDISKKLSRVLKC